LLKTTIELNKKLLPAIQKHGLEKALQIRIMKRVQELKQELKDIEDGVILGDEEDEGTDEE
jgi:hypothetical protein